MPIYEYRCQECEHQFDVLQKMADEALKDCPDCGKPRLTKLVSAPAFRLSGTGWYETDFKTDKDKKKNLADAKKEPGKTDSEKSSSGKNDSNKKESGDSSKKASAGKSKSPAA